MRRPFGQIEPLCTADFENSFGRDARLARHWSACAFTPIAASNMGTASLFGWSPQHHVEDVRLEAV
jgi:hypothetical protein